MQGTSSGNIRFYIAYSHDAKSLTGSNSIVLVSPLKKKKNSFASIVLYLLVGYNRPNLPLATVAVANDLNLRLGVFFRSYGDNVASISTVPLYCGRISTSIENGIPIRMFFGTYTA